MDIPPPSPTTAPSSTVGVGSSAAPFDYVNDFQNLSERLDTISLDAQQLRLDHQKDICRLTRDMHTLTRDFHAYREEQDQRFRELLAQQADML